MTTFPVYPLVDIEPVRGLGARLWDANGLEYLDAYGGHAVISIGHSHPHFLHRIDEQMRKLMFYSNSVQIPIQKVLADKLGQLSGLHDYQLFLVNSGAEANENALKVASFVTGKAGVVYFSGAFHGRTSAAVAVTDNPGIVAPVNAGHQVHRLPFNDVAGLQEFASTDAANRIAAVIVEGIQGVGGIQVPTGEFLLACQNFCRQVGALLILDEVQSGFGRTGKFFAYQHVPAVRPDVIAMAKGMGNGFPVGGILIAPEIKAKYGMLGTTFGGNHLACAASLAVLEVIEQEDLMRNAQVVGTYLQQKLSALPHVKEVRGVGLMLGIELDYPADQFRSRLLSEHRIFTGNASQKQTVRLLPPLNLTIAEAEVIVQAFTAVLAQPVVA